jgi:hypothetical protein
MAVTITLRPNVRMHAANRRLLGTNIQWDNSGDGMTTNGVPKSALYNRCKEIDYGSGFLRYPGGNKADNFDWVQGEGDLGSRGPNTTIFGTTQTTYFGTGEFLGLCAALGSATPFVQTDMLGPTSRVTAWMAAYPQIRDWEIGNEPYLQIGDEEFWIPPNDFVGIANSQIGAMLEQDPDVRIYVPLCPDDAGPIPGLHYPGYDAIVLRGIDKRIHRWGLHYYLSHGTTPQTDQVYWDVGMAAYRSAQDFLTDVKSDLAAQGRLADAELVMSEYGFTLQPADTYARTVFSAILQSDMLRVFALEPRITAALRWSIANNGVYGSINSTGGRRPSFWMHHAWDRLLHGDLIQADVSGATLLTNVQYARVFAYTDTPSMSVIATKHEGAVRAIALNKRLSNTEAMTVQIPEGLGLSITARPRVRCLQAAGGTDVFDDTDSESIYTYSDLAVTQTDARTITFTAPAASLMLIELETMMASRSIALNYNSARSSVAEQGGMVAVTAFTSGNPPVVTAPGHGFSNSDVIYLTGLGGVNAFLNDKFYTIGGVTADTFELTGLNSFGASGVGAQTTAIFSHSQSAPISGATQANPVVITAVGHGFVNGDLVQIGGVGGMTQINNLLFTVASAATDSFALSAINGTGFGAYTSGGQATRTKHTRPSVISNAGAVTANSHPFADGQKLRLTGSGITNIVYAGVPSVASADGLLYTVSGSSANAFSIATEFDGDGWGTYTSGGFAFRVSDLASLGSDIRVYYDASKTTQQISTALQRAREVLAQLD